MSQQALRSFEQTCAWVIPPQQIGSRHSQPSITVYALKENKRPIGFAPWPEEPTKKRKKGKKR